MNSRLPLPSRAAIGNRGVDCLLNVRIVYKQIGGLSALEAFTGCFLALFCGV